jgi:hypothetical protein
METANVEQVRLVCDEYGRRYRTAPRYVQRYCNDDDGDVVRRGLRRTRILRSWLRLRLRRSRRRLQLRSPRLVKAI